MAVPDLAFGNYPALSAPPAVLAATTITVTCELGHTYGIGLDHGTNKNGQQRRMARSLAPLEYLNYGIYRDSARTLDWGDTGPTRLDSTGTGVPQAFPVFGTLFGGQSVLAGAYVDTVTVTVRN